MTYRVQCTCIREKKVQIFLVKSTATTHNARVDETKPVSHHVAEFEFEQQPLDNSKV